jgi:hypothetical protein
MPFSWQDPWQNHFANISPNSGRWAFNGQRLLLYAALTLVAYAAGKHLR